MTDVTLNPTPSIRDVVREQVRIVGVSLRREFAVTALVISVITVFMVVDFSRGHAASWFDSDEWTPLGVIAFFYPFAVWRGARRFGPDFLWTLPVDRRRLALARVLAGWVWLMIAVASFLTWHRGLAVLAGVPHPKTVGLIALAGTTATYFFGSAVLLALRHPLRWIIATCGTLFVLGSLNDMHGEHGVDAFFSNRAFVSAIAEASTLITFLFAAAGLLAVLAAASRHGERRRR
jgi:hypothetical protein